jgi:hypothetical protein
MIKSRNKLTLSKRLQRFQLRRNKLRINRNQLRLSRRMFNKKSFNNIITYQSLNFIMVKEKTKTCVIQLDELIRTSKSI